MKKHKCHYCGKIKSDDMFYKCRLLGKKHKCKVCCNDYVKKWMDKQPIEKVRNWRMGSKIKIKQKFYAVKEATPCARCGHLFPPYVTDYHHREGTIKVNNVSTLIFSCRGEEAFEEIKKCDLLCANCHRIRTHERRESNKKR